MDRGVVDLQDKGSPRQIVVHIPSCGFSAGAAAAHSTAAGPPTAPSGLSTGEIGWFALDPDVDGELAGILMFLGSTPPPALPEVPLEPEAQPPRIARSTTTESDDDSNRRVL